MVIIPKTLRGSSVRLVCLFVIIGLLLVTTWPPSTAGKVWLGGIAALLLFPTLHRWLFSAVLATIVIAGYTFSLTAIETTETWLKHTYVLLVCMVVLEVSQRIPFIRELMEGWQHAVITLDTWCREQLHRIIASKGQAFSTVWRLGSTGTKRAWQTTQRFDRRYVARIWPWLLGAILIVLFIIPFTWFAPGEGDWGGDGSRLYFLDPWATFRGNLDGISEGGYGYEESVAFATLPFFLLLHGVQFLLPPYSNQLLILFDGFLLASSFGAVYLLIRDMSSRYSSHLITQLAALTGATFFIFLPLVTYNWLRPLPHFHQIAVYPLLLWLLLKYLRTSQYRYFLAALLLTVIFALNFGVYSAPVLIPFMLLASALLLMIAVLEQKLARLLRGSLAFMVLFVLLHAFHLIPQIYSITTATSTLNRDIFSDAGKVERGLSYFESIRPLVKLVYNITGWPQYTLYTKTAVSPDILLLLEHYGARILALVLVFPLLIAAGLLVSRWESDRQSRHLMVGLTVLWLSGLFFMTANLFGSWGPRLYRALFVIPGMSAMRSFYGAFAISFMLSYALALGFSLRLLLMRLRHPPLAITTTLLLVALLAYQARPFLRGQIFDADQPDTKDVAFAHRFPAAFIRMIEEVKKIELDAKFMTFPLTHFSDQIIEGDQGGAYVGPSPLTILAGKYTFSGFSMFDFPEGNIFTSTFFFDRLRAEDYRTIHRLLSLMNVGFFFENSSPLIYRDAFIGWPYSQQVWEIFPQQNDVHRFIQRLGYHPTLTHGPYTLYHYPEYFLPRLYIPRTTVQRPNAEGLKQYLVTEADYDIRTALYDTSVLSPDIAGVLPTTITQPPLMEYRAAAESVYLVRLHTVRQSVPLVFSQAWHPGWKLRVIPHQGATPDGLPVSPWRSVWAAPTIDDRYHLRTNEYAQSWWLDLTYLKQYFGEYLIANPDGSYEIDVVLEYVPQRYFYFGVLVSCLTLLGIGAFAFHNLRYERAAKRLGRQVM